MKPSLQLGIGQQLTLTPQLQQAIRFLQLSTLELQAEIEQALEQNPMLETLASEKEEEQTDTVEISEDSNDFQWEQLYSGLNRHHNIDDSDQNAEERHGTSISLQDHLRWQLELTPMSDVDRVIAMMLMDAVNEDGLLTQTVAELHASLDTSECPLAIEEIEAVRHRLQYFDPIGCFSENLSEILLIQLQVLPQSEEVLLARQIVKEELSLLGAHNYRQLMKIYHVNETALEHALEIIQKLNPKPGNAISRGNTEYVTPDVIVKKVEGRWMVSLNSNTLPKITINQRYAGMIARNDSSRDNQFLKEHLQEARWFLKSIESRQDTLLNVARCIMEHQKGFLEHGEKGMRPLILNDVAMTLHLHESTISRVTTQKYIHTPRGVFELKYFFSSHVPMENGDICSSVAIRAMIRKLIKEENARKPLSDSKMVLLMSEQGIHIARRTVAKYRESMGILPSHERKTISKSV